MAAKWHLTHAEHGNKPWAVQAEALRRAGDRWGYAWFLEQGLGKTSLALNDYVDKFKRGLVDTMVVVCPESFKIDWSLAPVEWGVPEISGFYHPKIKAPKLTGKGPVLWAVNYEAVRTATGKHIAELMTRSRVYLVVDESLALGTPGSATTKASIQLAKGAKFVRLLNGTPTARDVLHYYGQLKTIGELEGKNQHSFRNRYATMGGFRGKKVVGVKNEEELGRLLDVCSFRALKADWRKDLPPQVFTKIRLEMTPRQRSYYREMVEDFLTIVGEDENNLIVQAPLVLTQMDKLRQIASCLAMQDGDHRWLEEPVDNPKVQALEEILDHGPTKAIVSHCYRPSGEMLLRVLTRAGYDPVFIRGNEDPALLRDNKDRFNNDPKCRVIVCLQAAAFRGHTLIGGKGKDRCNRMVFFENSFSFYQRVQMQDRIHRGAQDQECQYFDLVTSPIEQVLVDTLKMRKDFADAMDKVMLAATEKV